MAAQLSDFFNVQQAVCKETRTSWRDSSVKQYRGRVTLTGTWWLKHYFLQNKKYFTSEYHIQKVEFALK